jgi:hypothetical protein
MLIAGKSLVTTTTWTSSSVSDCPSAIKPPRSEFTNAAAHPAATTPNTNNPAMDHFMTSILDNYSEPQASACAIAARMTERTAD